MSEVASEVSSDLQERFGGIDIYLFDQLLKGRIVPGMRVLDAGCGAGRNLVYFLRSGYEVFGVDESASQIAQLRKMAAALAPHLPAENFWVGQVEKLSADYTDYTERKAEATDGGTRGRGDAGKAAPGDLSTDYTDYTEQKEDGRKQKAEGGRKQDEERIAGGMPALPGFDVVLSSAVLHFARDEDHWQAMVNEMWRVLKPGGMLFARLASTIGVEDQIKLIEGRRYRLPDGSDRFLVDADMLHRVTAALGGEFLEPIKTTVVENMRAMTTWVLRK
jgi:tellurite methyltransferase